MFERLPLFEGAIVNGSPWNFMNYVITFWLHRDELSLLDIIYYHGIFCKSVQLLVPY